MPCDRRLLVGQSIRDRIKEVQDVVKVVETGLAKGTIKAIVGKQGAIAFQGLTDSQRNRVDDVCIYRRILSTGSALARMKLAAAGNVNNDVIAQGVHSHDGGRTWDKGH